MNSPPTAERTRKTHIRPSVVQNQSVIGTRVCVSSAQRRSGAISARKSAGDSASVAD